MKAIQHYSDSQLIQLFNEGNNQALEVLVNRYKDKLFTSIRILIKDDHLAEDIFQDIFIKIINSIRDGKYSEKGIFITWAMRIAHNLCIDHFRTIKRSPRLEKLSHDYDYGEVNIPHTDLNALDILCNKCTNDEISIAVESIPQPMREVLVLRHYGELSFKEIAAITNCGVNTALGRMRYALKYLRKNFFEREQLLDS